MQARVSVYDTLVHTGARTLLNSSTLKICLHQRTKEVKNEQSYRERECIHRAGGAEGNYYKGDIYVKHLMRLPSARAHSFAGRVTSFFWADAAQIVVWLCDDCASELGLYVSEKNLVR